MDWAWMILGWTGAVLGFGLLILIHELGHFVALKVCRYPVHAFSIGFGTPFWTRLVGETQIRLAWIPLGGYVMPESPEEIESREETEGTVLPKYPPWAQFFIAFMGPAANVVLAFILFFATIFFWGDPRPVPIVESTIRGGPTFVAGVRVNDRLISWNGCNFQTWEDFICQIQRTGLKPSFLELERNGTKITLPVFPVREGERFVVGIRPQMAPVKSPGPLASVRMAAARTWQETLFVLDALKRMFFIPGTQNVSGPIGILSLASDSLKGGLMAFLSLLAVLSVNLAVFNLLPIPPLDGIRIFVAFWQFVVGAPPREKILLPIYQWGAMGLAILFLLVTLKDVGDFFLYNF